MTFLDSLKEEATVGRTFNGATTYTTSLNANVDFFALGGSMRYQSVGDKVSLFEKAYNEDRAVALRNLVYMRDIRNGGLGERDMFHAGIWFLAKKKDEKALHVIMNNVADFGRWDDLFFIMKQDKKLFDYGLIIIKTQLLKDMDNMRKGKEISLLGKWLPNINAKNEERRAFGLRVANALGYTKPSDYKVYRKMLVNLREKLDLVEVKLAAKDYDSIDFSKLPSRAGFKYRSAFWRHISDRYSEFLEAVNNGEATMNGSLVMPDEIIKAYGYRSCISYEEQPELEAAWKSLKDTVKGSDENVIVVADTSASMWGKPWEVAEGLAIYTAERLEGPFKNNFITFSECPQLVTLPNDCSLRDKMNEYSRHSIIENTNIEAVFNLILDTAIKNNTPKEEVPSKIIIISDMEFDSQRGNGVTHFKLAKSRFEDAGYEMPDVVFWNVGARLGNLPVRYNEQGAALVSGFSTNILTSILNGKLETPEAMMLETLSNPAFDFIDEAI